MDGILLIDKPAGWTSHDVVAKVRNILKKEAGHKVKIGHCGTLDPFATGLLVLVVGNYTKKAAEFSKLDKTYEAETILGKTSTTGDPEGEITDGYAEVPSDALVEQVLEQFRGKYMQMPPKYSAKKIGGQRAYKLAREGKEVKLEPVEVEIYGITDVIYDYPKLSFTVSVSSGTYIRTLAEDIGERLNTKAYLSALRRTSVGKFSVRHAFTIDNLGNLTSNLQK
jgi:tRNA pseudouridine55 synthase